MATLDERLARVAHTLSEEEQKKGLPLGCLPPRYGKEGVGGCLPSGMMGLGTRSAREARCLQQVRMAVSTRSDEGRLSVDCGLETWQEAAIFSLAAFVSSPPSSHSIPPTSAGRLIGLHETIAGWLDEVEGLLDRGLLAQGTPEARSLAQVAWQNAGGGRGGREMGLSTGTCGHARECG